MPSPIVVSEELPADLLERYRDALRSRDEALLRRFDDTLSTMPGAAHLEAITFAVMDSHFDLHPELHDDASAGGADFKLSPPSGSPVFLECKYLERGAVAGNSGVPDIAAPPGGAFRQITPQIRTAVRGATAQLADTEGGPTIAVVGTDHRSGHMVMGALAAPPLLTSTTQLEIPMSPATGSAVGAAQVVATLRDSVFLARPPNPGDDLARLRVPVSAVLLIWFDLGTPLASLIGILNPWPRTALDPARFPGIPFIRFTSAPTITSRTLPPAEWIVG